MGNRFAGGIAKPAMPPLHRYLGNPVLSFIGRLFFRTAIGDFHCGLRGFSREAIQRLRLTSPGMEFASEMVVKATVARAEAQPRCRPPCRRTAARARRICARGATAGGICAAASLSRRAGCSSIRAPLLAATGAVLALALLPGPLRVGGIALDSATLIFAVAAVLVGSQMVMFHALATLHATAEGPAAGKRALRPAPQPSQCGQVLRCRRRPFRGGTAAGAQPPWCSGRWPASASSTAPPRCGFAAISTLAMALGVEIVTSGFLWGLMQTRRIGASASAPSQARNRRSEHAASRPCGGWPDARLPAHSLPESLTRRSLCGAPASLK